jgi:hypothetical protein
MAKAKDVVVDGESGTRLPEVPEMLVDLDTFLSVDGVSAVWINGLRVWLSSQDGIGPRPLSVWRQLLVQYQSLS